MSSTTQVIRQVGDLLASITGVSVLSQRTSGRSAVFELASVDALSAHALQDICQGANASLEPPLLQRDPDFHADKPRKFCLTVNIEPVEHFQYGALQFLGIHLVWQLRSTRHLSEVVANDFLQRWNSSRVGA
jgi:hypothetical protein